MLTTENKKVYEYVKRLIVHGIDKIYQENFGIEWLCYQVIILECLII